MSTATSGRAREYKVRDDMVDHGWHAIMRAAGSKGAADLLMAHDEHGAALVQVGTASKSLGPVERARFLTAADRCCALAVLAVAGGRQPITYWLVGPGTATTWQRWTP